MHCDQSIACNISHSWNLLMFLYDQFLCMVQRLLTRYICLNYQNIKFSIYPKGLPNWFCSALFIHLICLELRVVNLLHKVGYFVIWSIDIHKYFIFIVNLAFSIKRCPSLLCLTLLGLNSYLLDIKIAASAFLLFSFSWNTFIHPSIFCLAISFCFIYHMNIAYSWVFRCELNWESFSYNWWN